MRSIRRRLRFALWARRLRRDLGARGATLVLDAPHGALLHAPPRLRIVAEGAGGATTTLRLGRNVRIGHDVVLTIWARGDNVLELADDVELEDNTRVHLRSGAVRLGRGTILRDYCLLKSDGELIVGVEARLGHGSVIHCQERVEIGDYVGMAESGTIIDSDHTWDDDGTPWHKTPLAVTPVRVGRNVLVAAGARITRGANVGDESVVAANAVVTAGDYPPRCVLGGVPARVLKGGPDA